MGLGINLMIIFAVLTIGMSMMCGVSTDDYSAVDIDFLAKATTFFTGDFFGIISGLVLLGLSAIIIVGIATGSQTLVSVLASYILPALAIITLANMFVFPSGDGTCQILAGLGNYLYYIKIIFNVVIIGVMISFIFGREL